MEILVNGDGHVVTDAEDSAKRIGAQTHVRILTHVLKALALLLHGIVGGTETVDLNLAGLYLARLTLALTLHEQARGADAGAGSDALELVLANLGRVYDDLDILDG